jgi:hypothetical protein
MVLSLNTTSASPRKRSHRVSLSLGFATVVIAVVVLSENNTTDILAFTDRLYTLNSTLRMTPASVLIFAAATIVWLTTPRLGLPRLVRPALLATLAAVALGMLVGFLNGGHGSFGEAQTVLYLVAVPLIVTAILHASSISRVVDAVLALALIKGLVGIANVVTATGVQVGGYFLSYYQAGSNYITMVGLFLAVVLIRRRAGHRWLAASAAIFSAGSLYLSERRSFWIAAVLGLVFIAILDSDRWRTLFVVFSGLIAGAAVILVLTVGSQDVTANTNPTSESAAIHAPIGDIYRTAERENVLDNLSHVPLTGLGFGVPWVQYQPLPGYFAGNTLYTHVGILWFWLKMGLAGVAIYLAWLAVGFVGGWPLIAGRSSSDVACLAVVCVAALLADVILELTATFVGDDPRYTLMFAATAAAPAVLRDISARRSIHGTSSASSSDAKPGAPFYVAPT